MASQFPIYNIKAVLKETGLKADVLRAWERRYELPNPQRTPGGHRLYSEHDIQTVKWLRSRQSEGLSISRAVELWKEVLETGRDPLVEYSQPGFASVPAIPLALEPNLEIFRQGWLEACLAFDGARADGVLNQAFLIYPVETVCTEIIQQGIRDIGNAWYQEKATIQQEHFASAMAARRLETLIAAAPAPTRRQTILLGCPPGERHTLSILLLALLLQRRGLNVVYLGADIPLEQIAETISAVKPDLITLAAQQLPAAAALQAMAVSLQGMGIPLAYGGLIFNRIPELRRRITAHFLGETLDEAVRRIEQLVITPVLPAHPAGQATADQELARLYHENRPLIEIAVFEALREHGKQTDYLTDANFFFGGLLSAALELGNLAFIEADLGWVRGLLHGRQIQPGRLAPFLAAYSQAAGKEMGAAGARITDWIEAYLTEDRSATQSNNRMQNG